MVPRRHIRRLWVLGLLLAAPAAAFGQECAEDVLCVVVEEHGSNVQFFVDNLHTDDLIVVFDVDVQNMAATVSLPHEATYPGGTRTYAFSLQRQNMRARWAYAYRYSWRKKVNTLTCADDLFCVEAEERDGRVEVYVDNRQLFEITVELDLELEQAVADAAFPHRATYPPRRRTRAFSLRRVGGHTGIHYGFTYRWSYGRLHARHDDAFAYALPYAPGKAYPVVQGFDGAFSHQGEYAVDWDMPERTPVHAARGGLVVSVVDRHAEGGLEERLKPHANRILIHHDDGTLGSYAHLARNGAFVRVGQRVARGQVIGVSGNTGYSSGPHLHFEVFTIAGDLSHRTVPIRFRLDAGSASVLQEGRAYTAPLR